MASEASRRVVRQLWRRPLNDSLTLEEWRHAASGASRVPPPPDLRGEAVDASGVEAEWSWLGGDDPEAAGAAFIEGDAPVVLVFHGGGFIVCDVPTYRLLSAKVAAAAGGRALVVGYRRAPEHPFPAAVEDCATAYGWLLDLGVDPGRVVFFGDSAGGNLCLSATLLARDRGLPVPGAIVAVSPAPDLTFRAASNTVNRAVDPFSRIDNRERMLDYYLRGADPLHPLASPLYADLTGFPPMLVLVGPDETHVDDSLELADRACAAGVDAVCDIVDGAFHTWLGYFDVVPEADASIARIGRFIGEHLPSGARPALS
jgi:acetyl esterase/lipase